MEVLKRNKNNDIDKLIDDLLNIIVVHANKDDKFAITIGNLVVLLASRLTFSYEELIYKEESVKPKNIILSNISYKDDLKTLIEKLDNSSHTLASNNAVVEEAQELIRKIEETPLSGFIYQYKSIDEIEKLRETNTSSLYNEIIGYDVYLKDYMDKDTNLNLIKLYYEILTSEDMFKAFYDYINFKVIRNDKIKYLIDNIEYKYLKYLGDILFFNKEDLEVLFLLYILAEEVYDIPLNKIEEVFSEETTFNLYESVENVTYSNIDNMYLENSFKYSELIRRLKDNK